MYRPIQVVLWSGVILCCMRTGAAQDDVAKISEAVLLKLLPYINDIKDDLSCVKNDLTNLNNTVSNLSVTVSDLRGDLEDYEQKTGSGLRSNTTSQLAELHTSLQSNTQQLTQLSAKTDTLDSKLSATLEPMISGSDLSSLNATMGDRLGAIEIQLNKHTNKLDRLNTSISNIHSAQLVQISTKIDTLYLKLDNGSILTRKSLGWIKEDLDKLNQSVNRMSDDVEEHEDHMTTKLMSIDQLQRKFMAKLTFYFGFIIPIHTCGGRGGWRRVVNLDMTDPNTNCPSGWQLTSHSKRTCGRVSNSYLSCDSVTFPVSGGDYTRVCGRIKGYQYGVTDAFETYHVGEVTTIDGAYVSGVSLTHGSRRQHIWTFAAGYSENHPTRHDACPCDATINITIPPFVGGDYFCESGQNSGNRPVFFPDDPLWDGYGCTATSTCCSFSNPPYFTKQLPSPTTDDIEARICRLEFNEDTPIELIELYVQ